jgi:hypothetical protein
MSITAAIDIDFAYRPSVEKLIEGLGKAGWVFPNPFDYMHSPEQGCIFVEVPLERWRDALREVIRYWDQGLYCSFVVVGPDDTRLSVALDTAREVHIQLLGWKEIIGYPRWPDFTWYLSRLLPAFKEVGMDIEAISCYAYH